MFDFLSMKKNVDSLQKRYEDTKAELVAVNTRIRQVGEAPMNKADLVKIVDPWIKKSAAAFAPAVAAHCTKHYRRGNGDRFGFFALVKNNADDLTVSAMDGAMCAVFGEQIKRAIVAAIDEMEWPGEGLPIVQREIEVKRLHKRAEDLYQEIEEITQGAAAAGIYLR